MNTFPNLKTGAVAQYPVRASHRFRTETLTFLDGAEQRFPLRGRGLRTWAMTYTRLDEGEMQQLRNFVAGQAESNTPFAFTDPESGLQYDKCRLSEWVLKERWEGEEAGEAVIKIEEVME